MIDLRFIASQALSGTQKRRTKSSNPWFSEYDPMRKCVKCLAETDEGQLICRRCGSKKFFVEKESEVSCPACGANNPKGNSECYSCGHAFLGGHAEY